MYRYRKRPAAMLSGGEKQRVGIARAIVKNPNIVIADEPTGNLDSKNSVEIMNIIKAIARDRLVILVTHETPLANFYASRIIEIVDGKIEKDYENEHEDALEYTIDNRFYLKDFKKEDHLKQDSYDINVYADNKSSIKLDIVIKNNNIYIRSNNDKKIEVVDGESNIEMINDHYKKMDKKKLNQYKFDFKDIIDENKKLKYSSIFNPITFITNGFQKVFNYSIIKKILLIGFFLSGFFIMLATSRIAANLKIEDKDFIKMNKNYLTVLTNKINTEDYFKYKNEKDIHYIMPTNSIVNFTVKTDDFYQTSKQSLTMSGSLAAITMLKKENIIDGTLPTNALEIVVDKLTIQNMLKEESTQMMGFTKEEDFLNRIVTIPNLKSFKIVGITDLKSPSIYVDASKFTDILYHMPTEEGTQTNGDVECYSLFKDKIKIKEGRAPTNDYEVIVNYDLKEEMKLNKEIKKEINKHKLKVVGYYTTEDTINYYFVNENMILHKLIEKSKNITIYPKNKQDSLEYFRNNYGINIKDSYEVDKKEYKTARSTGTKVALISSAVILGISFIEIILMLRSSFLSRIKEVGVYRAIGVKKKDIYIMFSGEIIAITTLASIPGILLSAYILNTLGEIELICSEFLITPFLVTITILCLYIFNLIIGLIPVFNTIRKRPAEILSRTDV